MSEVAKEPFKQPLASGADRAHRRRRTQRRPQTRLGTNDTAGASAETAGANTETVFWARIEEREEGRLSIEADHLFDTSYTWAT